MLMNNEVYPQNYWSIRRYDKIVDLLIIITEFKDK